MAVWSPASWQQYNYQQAAAYQDEQQLALVLNQLHLLPPLVTSNEIKKMKQAVALAGRGEAFILQGGDCAESFDDCRAEMISNKLKILLQMSLVLFHGLQKPIIKVGRIAGQYAKPRSSDFETINGITLPSYRGDLINSAQFNAALRTPNPALLLQGYYTASITLNFIRALINSGFANLSKPEQWDLHFIKNSNQAEGYQDIVNSITNSLKLLTSIEAINNHRINNTEFYTSHEALHLHYEQALTRRHKDGLWYNTSTHLPWLGIRTGQLDSAHVEYLRGIQNPVGIKVGPAATPEWLTELLKILNPQREEGKILLITRLGVDHIAEMLPLFIKTVKAANIPVTWSCDPMHGNTEITAEGIKTRHFDNILTELKQTWLIHQSMSSYLGGVHFELTGDNVTECIGGARNIKETDLKTAYHSLVDPRLNYEQSLEMAIQLSRLLIKKFV